MTIHVREHFTIYDLENLPDDGKRREIIDGDWLTLYHPLALGKIILLEFY